ncbi:DUF6048 family protein [Neotamlana laminarinivorans]|uniref:DUF6048 family protein n=1 Tax=Neotamlana laminarinivorans TaxID=2883124 RepID=A0A9X1HWC0_9FLAO|nr:DUF6048 family protein [Tamlana laminarinivorans]MCB4797374.1 DUF6048 family protein [Tamlana laminarinivorans]
MKHTLALHISIAFSLLVLCAKTQAQNNQNPPKPKPEKELTKVNDTIINTQENDSTAVKLKYGLRAGIDLGKILQSYLDDDYSGFEVLVDYRLKPNLYIAGELGIEEKNTITDYLDVTTTGSYLKAGIDLNAYDNWLDMDNMIYFGFRVGASTFNQTLNEYTIYTTDQYWAPQLTSTEAIDYDGLTAFWAEVLLGFKVELFNNLYLGANLQLKFLASESQPDNFEVLYIPGYGKTYDSGIIGAGYSYFLSYRIPLYKRSK